MIDLIEKIIRPFKIIHRSPESKVIQCNHSWIKPYPDMPSYCRFCLVDKDESAFDDWMESGHTDK